jgi:hypothetical protein
MAGIKVHREGLLERDQPYWLTLTAKAIKWSSFNSNRTEIKENV